MIVKKLQDELGGKKYLLVLDDLWRVDSWHDFVDTLKGISTCRGNCILVTTRIKRVATTVTTVAVDLHMLGKLAEVHCWSIFKQRAFADGEIPEEIINMGNRIIEMCQGLYRWLQVCWEASFVARKNMNGRQFLVATPLLQVEVIMGRIT